MMVHIGATDEPTLWSTLDHDFHRFGSYHKWAQETARRTWALDKRGALQTDTRLSIHTTHLLSRQTVVRHTWQTIEDFLPFAVASCHVPVMSGAPTYNVPGLGGCLDGGALRLNPHPEWETESTLKISPWRFSDPTTIGPSRPLDARLVYRPDIQVMRATLDQGYVDASRWFKRFGFPFKLG